MMSDEANTKDKEENPPPKAKEITEKKEPEKEQTENKGIEKEEKENKEAEKVKKGKEEKQTADNSNQNEEDPAEKTTDSTSEKKEEGIKPKDPVLRSSLKFFALHLHYIAVVIILLVYSYFAYDYFGIDVDTIMTHGTWFSLGAFSPFFYLAIPMVISSAILLLHAIFTTRTITFGVSEDDEFIIKERRLLLKGVRRIPKDTIQTVRYIKGYIGPKFMWVVVFGTHMLLLFMDGLGLALNPESFGLGIPQGVYYIIGGIAELISLILILGIGDECLEIRTDTHLYKMRYKPVHPNVEILGFLQSVFDKGETRHENLFRRGYNEDWKQQFSRFYDVILGLFLILMGILSLILRFYMGTLLAVISIFLGVIILVSGIKEQPITMQQRSRSEIKSSIRGSGNSVALTEHNFTSKMGFWANMANSNYKISVEFRKPNVFMVPLWMFFMFLSGWTVAIWFRFLPSTSVRLGMSVLQIVCFVITVGFVAIHALRRYKSLVVDLDDGYFSIPLKEIRWGFPWRSVKSNSKKKQNLIARLASLIIPLIIGLIIALV